MIDGHIHQSKFLDEYIAQVLFHKLPSPAFDDYYIELLCSQIPEPSGNYFLQCVLNFGVQELAVRSLVSPESEHFVQIGCFHPRDFAVSNANGMPHTKSFYCETDPSLVKSDEIKYFIDQVTQKFTESCITQYKLINEDYLTFLEEQPNSSIGYLAILNIGILEKYKAILSDLSRLLTTQGTCLIVDLANIVQELADFAQLLDLNQEYLFIQSSHLMLQEEGLGWLLLKAN